MYVCVNIPALDGYHIFKIFCNIKKLMHEHVKYIVVQIVPSSSYKDTNMPKTASL